MQKKNILNDFQKQVLKLIGQSKLKREFHWGGGTLLSYLYLQHRLSEDLDFFSEDLYPDEFLINEMKSIVKKTKSDKLEYIRKLNRHLFTIFKKSKALKIEFVYFPFPHLKKPTLIKEFGVFAESFDDIATNKLFAAYERGDPKDAYDIYYILKTNKYSLDKLAKNIEKKFGVSIDIVFLSAKLLEAISNLEEIKPLIFNYQKNLITEMEEYFKEKSYSILKKKIKRH